jgi:hypothetical protein
MKMEQIECSKTSAYKIQTPGNHPEENIQHTEHGESLKSINILHTYPPMKMEQTDCSKTSAYKIQTPGNYPEESIQHSEHGKRLKSRIIQFAVSINVIF